MNSIILLLALVGGDDGFKWAVDAPSFSWSVERSGDPASSLHDAEDRGTDAPSAFVHRIDVSNHSGSCVCIAPGVFVTAKHIFEGLSGYQVSIDGQAVAASVTFAPSHDVAIVQLGSETAAAPVEIGDAAYLANCTAYGMFSKTEHVGLVSNNDTLSLTSDGAIAQGDSGGGVFSDGKLVGVIRGRNPENHRVCFFTPMAAVASLTAPFSRETAEASAPSPGADTKPALTIISPASWECVHCPGYVAQDWSQFNATKERRDGLPSYPCAEWTDKRGVIRRLYGAYTPSQVMWSWERTQ